MKLPSIKIEKFAASANMAKLFSGFHPKTLRYLATLKRNNNREWFQENKQRYENEFLAPALAFIEAIEKPLTKISPCLRAVPKKTGGSLMRIYRDTRFGKDKTPYKTNIGIHFRHVSGCDVHAPGCYVHVEPKNVFVGAGVWRPDSKALAKIRPKIDADPAGWERASRGKAFRDRFELAGDSLKRPPAGFAADHPLIGDIKRKDFIGVAQLADDTIFSDTFLDECLSAFRAARPLMRFLCQAVEVPF